MKVYSRFIGKCQTWETTKMHFFRRMDKLVHSKKEYYSMTKGDELSKHKKTWRKVECLLLSQSERRQSENIEVQNDFGSFPRKAIQYHSNSSLCPYHWHQRSWSWSVLWRPRRPPRTNTKKKVPFIIGDWKVKVGSQEIPGVTGKFGLGEQNEAKQRLTEFCQENAFSHSKYPFSTTQEMTLHMDITKWSILKWNWLHPL